VGACFISLLRSAWPPRAAARRVHVASQRYEFLIASLLGGAWLCLVCAPLLRRARAVALRFARLRLGLDLRAGLARLGLAPPKEDDDAELADDDLAHLLGVAPAAAPQVAGVEMETAGDG
jgi:hypothetical protein